jgi:hypothetical protein
MFAKAAPAQPVADLGVADLGVADLGVADLGVAQKWAKRFEKWFV